MHFEIDDELQPLRQLAEKFAGNELAPGLMERDDFPVSPFSQETLNKAGELGLLSVMLSEERGGSGQGMRGLCVILQALAEVDAGFAAVLLVNALAQSAQVRWGGDEGPDPARPGLLSAFPAYNLPTDPGGSLVAEKGKGGYLLQGTVEYLPLAPVADCLILPAQFRDSEKTAFFQVEAAGKGVTVDAPVLSLGLRPCPVADVRLSDVKVPETALLCADAETGGLELAAFFRPAVAAMSLGVLTGSLRDARRYAEERVQGGRVIVEHDMVRLMLADMALAVETGRLLVRKMAEEADRGTKGLFSRAALLLVTEQAVLATGEGVQVLGGYGYMQDYGQEKRMRDAKQIESLFGGPMAGRLDLATEFLGREL